MVKFLTRPKRVKSMNTENFDLRLEHYNIILIDGVSYDYFLTDWNGKYKCRIYITSTNFVEGWETTLVEAIKSAIKKIAA